MKKLRWGIIGCGNVTEVKSGPAFQKIPDSSIVAVMRRDAVKAADYAKRHGIEKSYSIAEDLIHDSDVNAIYIATPPDTHAYYTLMCLEAGKAVYVEKPMAINAAEAVQMVEASEKFKIPIFVAYYRRALSGFLKVKELIENNAVGAIKEINLQLHLIPREEDFKPEELPWRVRPEKSGGGYFFDLASHQLDWLYFVFGSPKFISSQVENRAKLYKAEDFVQAKLLYPNQIKFNGSWDFCSTEEEATDLIEIIGTKGKISFSTFEFSPIQLENDKGIQHFSFEKPKHVQMQLIKEVVDELLGKGYCSSKAQSALITNQIMHQIVYGEHDLDQ